jgi:hypothetical protein
MQKLSKAIPRNAILAGWSGNAPLRPGLGTWVRGADNIGASLPEHHLLISVPTVALSSVNADA